MENPLTEIQEGAAVPRVSVLMCASNAGAFINEAIESILGQTFTDFELVVIENGSIDETWEAIQRFGDSRIRAFQTKLKQLPFNLNFGLMQARAPLIARMDADDIAHRDRLAAQVEYMNLHPEVTVLGTFFEVFGADLNSRLISPPTTDAGIRASLPFRFSLCHPTVMVRKDILLRFRGYEHTRYCEDLDLWLRMARDSNVHFANLPRPLLKYRVHGTQAKGSWEAYCSTCSILLKEGLVLGDARLLFAAVLVIAKGLALRSKAIRRVLSVFPFFRSRVF